VKTRFGIEGKYKNYIQYECQELHLGNFLLLCPFAWIIKKDDWKEK
jgi:hypothetical protein